MIAAVRNLRWESLPPLWLVVLIIVPVVFFLVRFFYKREAGRVGRRLRVTMGLLRVAAILLVLVVIWGPYSETIESEPFKRHLILAIDTSGSMEFRDDYASSAALAKDIREAASYPGNTDLSKKQRIEIVRDVVGRSRDYLARLAETFRLHVYTFDSAPAGLFDPREGEQPERAADRILGQLERLQAKGDLTRIGTAIRDLVRVFDARNEPVAGILMFTDGRHTGGAPDPAEEARRAKEGTHGDGIQIFPVAIGNPATAVNVGVTRIDAPEVVLAGDEVAFTVHVHARGLAAQPAELRTWVLDAEGKPREQLPVAAPAFSLPPDGDTAKVTFRHTFHEPGTFNLRIGVPPVRGEAVEDDNYGLHLLHVTKLKMRVLMVASKPNYTFRFLGPALRRAEKTIEANTLLMSAEPDWPQEGFDPVKIFPQDRAELARYDVVILLDADPDNPRFAPGGEDARIRVLANIEHWVKQGGGLILQAGRDRFIPDGFDNTPMMGLMPIVPYTRLRDDQYQEIVRLADQKRHKLTNDGLVHPILRILQEREMVRDFWDSNEYATEYFWHAPVVRTKSSATALTVRRSVLGRIYRNPQNDEMQPIVAIQNYGLGKVLWLGTDELWRLRRAVGNLYYWRFWSGAIRHLATYRLLSGNKRIKIWLDAVDRRYRVGDSVEIEAKFLDVDFEPVEPPGGKYEGFERKLKLRTPTGEEQEITLHGIELDPAEGLFRARLHAGKPGTYRLIAEPESDEQPAETSFVVDATTLERHDPLMDMETLRAVARESQRTSKPKVLRPGQFRRLIEDEIVPRTGVVRSGETQRTDMWDRAWVLWVFVGLLAAEWILRRMSLLL